MSSSSVAAAAQLLPLPRWAPRGLLIFSLFGLVGSGVTPAPHGRFCKGRIQINGKLGWVMMESVAPIVALVSFRKFGGIFTPSCEGAMALLLYMTHYLNRSVLSPLVLAPSVGPVTPLVMLSAMTFNTLNATGIGAWSAAASIQHAQWSAAAAGGTSRDFPSSIQAAAGILLFALGAAGNIWHDLQLYRLRDGRAGNSSDSKNEVKINGRVYKVPKNGGLFSIHPNGNYICEIFEWIGLWMFLPVIPIGVFVASMMILLPIRAWQNLSWYRKHFTQNQLPTLWCNDRTMKLAHATVVVLGLSLAWQLHQSLDKEQATGAISNI